MEDLFANPIALGLILISSFIGFWMFKSLPKNDGSDKPYIPNIDDLPKESNSEDNFIYRGPRGGWFRINRNGRKSYDVKRPD